MSKFQVGDKVRYKRKTGPWAGPCFEYYIRDGDVGVVSDKGFYDGHVIVKFGVADYVPIDELELIETSDPKREFLERLQSLMREYDAEINIGLNVDGKESNGGILIEMSNDRIFLPIILGDTNDAPAIVVQRSYSNYPITADNIMDFAKE